MKRKSFSKVVNNPEVTLDIEGHGIPEDARDAAFLDWLCSFVAVGDDGKQYWFGCSPLILASEDKDLWHYELCWDTGEVIQSPTSIYKVADFPPVNITGQFVYPGGTLKVEKSDTQVRVSLGNFQVICKDDKSWHYTLEDEAKGIKAEFVHYGAGYPLWYGKEAPSYLTQHSIAYGYNWSGIVEGKLTIHGREIKIKGRGVRERYIAVDSSAAEIGGWEDWMWFHFDEAFGSLYEMRLGLKDMVLNVVDGKQYFPAGDFHIEHQEWVFFPALGAFIPTVYKVTMETEGGVLEYTAHVANATVWGVTGKVPDNPVATLNWDKVEGTFTGKDGHKQLLTNGMGGVSIRQWKPYPSLFPVDLAGSNALHTAPNKLNTL
ncbi:MAG TPA: hypothetical protein DDZ96_02355 [Porphyromonadaceae bacterium]|jgi:hypothetical protein|nr:hypothetical protein [Porphyromonadaceae bacterium]HBX20959.1 hypothetical protein [Porphyromonadaceae bacterium]HCM20534.1 hypothetical protein [Porphyromonadaceae bacterium]